MPFAFDELLTASSGIGSQTKFLQQQHLQHFQQIMPAVSSSHLIITSTKVHPKNPCTTSTLTTSSTLLLNNTPDISAAVATTTPTSVATSYSSVSAATTVPSLSSSSCESGILSGSSPLTSLFDSSFLSTPSAAAASSSTQLSLGPVSSSNAVVAGVTNSLTAPVIGTVDSKLQQPQLTALVTTQTPNSPTATVTSTLPLTVKTHAVTVTTASDPICTGALPTATVAIVSPSLASPLSSTSSSPPLAAPRVPAAMSAPSASAQLLLNGLVAAGCVRDANTQQQQYQHQILADDPRALQLALELSMVSLTEAVEGVPINNGSTNNATLHLSNYQQQLAVHHQHQQHQKQQHHHSQQQQSQSHQQQYHSQQFDLSTLNAINAAVAAAASANNSGSNSNNINSIANATASNNNNIGNHTLNQFPVSAALLPTIEDRSKKSQNMTECVPVPSSEHVAEIVGRQGCKIKALRAKTNTYIKTPVRNEEPVFVVTGRKEDVAKAKREILSAAEHFSLIRATRKPSIDGALSGSGNSGTGGTGGANGCGKTPPGPPSIPGQVTIQVRVPYRVVGLVVGPKGATIKHIQQETQTYIVTPSREKEPIFEVTGLPDNVQSARKQIEAHIALRTGNLPLNNGSGGNAAMMPTINDSLASVHNLNALSEILSDATDPDLLATLYKTDSIRSAFDYLENGSNMAAAAAAAAVSSIVSPNGLNSSSLNFNIGNNGGIDGNMANQLLMSSLSNCNNIQSQSLNGTHQSNDYLNSLISNCNLGDDGGSLVTDVGDMVLQHQSHPSSNNNAHMQQQQQQHVQSVGSQVHSSFIGSTNSYSALNTTALNTMNLNGITNAANTTLMGTGTNIHTMVNGAQNNGHHSGGSIGMTRSCSSASSTTSSKSANNSGSSSNNSSSSRPELMNIWKNLGDSLDVDEGIGDSPSIWALPTPLTALTGSHCSPSTSISPTDSLLGEISAANHHNHGLSHLITQHEIGSQKNLHLQQQNQQLSCDTVQQNINLASMRRECLVCSDKEVTAVLVPCGHNMFCMECANRICSSGDATCPVCSLTVYHAMRILA